MATWANICQLVKYADCSSEINYQTSIKEMVLEVGLGWHADQISEQQSLTLGSTSRLVPDIILKKDDANFFIIEMKEATHLKMEKDISQLVSYMKQLETPVGIYIGNEIEVYYKYLGDGSLPLCVLSLSFNSDDPKGEDFVRLFSEKTFSIESLKEYAETVKEKAEFESKVKTVLDEMTAPDYESTTLRDVILNHYTLKGVEQDVTSEALSRLSIRIEHRVERTLSNKIDSINETIRPSFHKRRNIKKSGARGFAYGLTKAIIERNPTLSFQQLHSLFGYRKNYIEKSSDIKVEKCWYTSDEDIITLSDGTPIAISNQWGFNNNCKPKMDRLREIASRFDIDASLPF